MSAVPWLLIALAPAPVAIATDEAAATVTRVAFHLPVAFTEASSLYSCTINRPQGARRARKGAQGDPNTSEERTEVQRGASIATVVLHGESVLGAFSC